MLRPSPNHGTQRLPSDDDDDDVDDVGISAKDRCCIGQYVNGFPAMHSSRFIFLAATAMGASAPDYLD